MAVVVPWTTIFRSAGVAAASASAARTPSAWLRDGRRHLGHAHGAGDLVEEHEVGEGAADVHADEQGLP